MKPLKLAAKLRGQALHALWKADIDPTAPDARQQLASLMADVAASNALFDAVSDAVMQQTDETGAGSGDIGNVAG